MVVVERKVHSPCPASNSKMIVGNFEDSSCAVGMGIVGQKVKCPFGEVNGKVFLEPLDLAGCLRGDGDGVLSGLGCCGFDFFQPSETAFRVCVDGAEVWLDVEYGGSIDEVEGANF